MHSMHSWAQMVEQTLVIILFIERSDMHVYAFPKKERKEPCDLHFHLPMQRQAFSLEPWLVAKIIRAYIILSIEGFQCDLFWGGFGLFGGCFNPGVSDHVPWSSESLQGCSNQTLCQMILQISSSCLTDQ